MFDIGFSELVVIGVIALLVFGPEDLPRVARTVGHLLGKLRRYVADVKSEINREMEDADLKRLQAQVQDSVQSIQATVNEQARLLEDEFRQVSSSLDLVQDEPHGGREHPFSLQAPDSGVETHDTTTVVPEEEADGDQLDLFAQSPSGMNDSEKKGL